MAEETEGAGHDPCEGEVRMAKRKPRETKTFHYHNENPKGYRTGDCRYRAYALASGVSWEKTILTVALWSVKTGIVDYNGDSINEVLQEFGNWVKHPMPKHPDGTRYTARELAKEMKNEPNPIIFTITHHTSCIKDGKIWDTWDCGEWCVYNYWTLGN